MTTNTWLRIADIDRDRLSATTWTHPTWIYETAQWVSEVIGRPEPALNRPGAVCPFVPAALERNLIFITVDEHSANVDDVSAAMLSHVDAFLAATPSPPEEEAIYKCLLVAFPSVAAEEVVKSARMRIKPSLLPRGITCGEFYSSNDDRSVRNAAHFIARSPRPMIALRYLTPHDELFLASQPELYEIFRAHRPGSTA